MRAVFLGNAAWSVPSLEALADAEHRVELVATRVPRPAGRGSRLTPTPVAEAARRLGFPLAEVETVKSGPGFEALMKADEDQADALDKAHAEMADRALEVNQVIAAGAS